MTNKNENQSLDELRKRYELVRAERSRRSKEIIAEAIPDYRFGRFGPLFERLPDSLFSYAGDEHGRYDMDGIHYKDVFLRAITNLEDILVTADYEGHDCWMICNFTYPSQYFRTPAFSNGKHLIDLALTADRIRPGSVTGREDAEEKGLSLYMEDRFKTKIDEDILRVFLQKTAIYLDALYNHLKSKL